jgi:hypothetical protein
VKVDLSNKFLVSGSPSGETVHIQRWPPGPMPKADALLLAAWIVALADPAEAQFSEILDGVLDVMPVRAEADEKQVDESERGP